MDTTKLVGTLDAYAETGTEGIIWSFTLSGVPGYEGLITLEEGDDLLIYGDRGTVAWQGSVALEYKRNFERYPLNPQYGQQSVFGMWVHGLQRDCSPEDWGRFFLERRPAVLVLNRELHYADSGAVVEFIADSGMDEVGLNPVEAFHKLENLSEHAAASMKQFLPHAWGYQRSRLGWNGLEVQKSLDFSCGDEALLKGEVPAVAKAWRLLLASDLALRSLWEEPHPSPAPWSLLLPEKVRNRWKDQPSFEEDAGR